MHVLLISNFLPHLPNTHPTLSQGNSSGSCYVFDAEDGKRVAQVSAIKVSAPVRSCGLSEDCRHLVAAIGNGFIFRFEYLGAAKAAEGNENADGNAAAAGQEGGAAAMEGAD